MTDGCAYINKAGLLRLQAHFQWRSFPTAVQCRLAGTKVLSRPLALSPSMTVCQGLLSLHPDVDSSAQDRPTVWVRPSQVKIKYPDYTVLDPAMLVIDIVQASHMKPGRLKAETVINLAENDVPHKILVQLLQNGLDEHITGLIQWEGPEAMLELWCNLAHKGGVMAARRARDASGEARARGYRYTENDDEDDGEDGVWETAELKELAAKWWLDEVWRHFSLCSSSIMLYLPSAQQHPFVPRGDHHDTSRCGFHTSNVCCTTRQTKPGGH
jgi:RNA-dependent RNA polymerase